jgi:hypothetical protein
VEEHFVCADLSFKVDRLKGDVMIKLFEAYIKLLKNKRTLVIFGTAFAILSILSLFSNQFSRIFYGIYGVDLSATGLPFVFLLFSGALFSLLYLQSGKGGEASAEESPILETLRDELENHRHHTSAEIKAICEKLEVFESKSGLTVGEKEKIINGIIEHVNHDVVSSIFNREATKFKEDLVAGLSIDRLTSSSNAMIGRLKREVADLRLRSNINLIIGMAITTIGVYLLWNTVSMIDTSALLKALASEGEESNQKFIKNLVLPLVPRVLLVVFVEVFAYFFLSLYKSCLSEIKHFQNELTNVESKLAAVEFSYMTKNQDGIKLAVEALSKTERNFILEKGQTTVELEKAKSESELTRNIIKTIPSFFQKAEK